MTRDELRTIGAEWQAITRRMVHRLHAVPGQLAVHHPEAEALARELISEALSEVAGEVRTRVDELRRH